MQRILLILFTLLLFSGCQSASRVQLDYNTQLDFSHWHGWQWAEPAVEFASPSQYSDLDSDRIRDVVSEQLLQKGLLPSDTPDFLVRAWLEQQERIERVPIQRGGFWHDPWGRYWSTSGWIEVEELRYRVFVLQLDLLDAATGKLAWRASEQWPASASANNPQKREAELRKVARKLLLHFPPRPQ